MNRVSLIGGFSIMVLFVAVATAETPSEHPKSKEIPLDQIWGYKLPGTRDVRELEPKADPKLLSKELEGLSPVDAERRMSDEFTRRLDHRKILKALNMRPKADETAGTAFVVAGTGKAALANAALVFAGSKERQTVFPPDADLSLVFYSYDCGRYVRLRSVDRWSNFITVRYQFVAHATMEITKHFALIPIGKLSEGDYHVKVEQLAPFDERGLPPKPISEPQSIVSGSFAFVVQNK